MCKRLGWSTSMSLTVLVGGMLTFAELVHATHALGLRAHAVHAPRMLTFAALVHATHAFGLRAHAVHATPM